MCLPKDTHSRTCTHTTVACRAGYQRCTNFALDLDDNVWSAPSAFKFFTSGRAGFAPAPDGWHMWLKTAAAQQPAGDTGAGGSDKLAIMQDVLGRENLGNKADDEEAVLDHRQARLPLVVAGAASENGSCTIRHDANCWKNDVRNGSQSYTKILVTTVADCCRACDENTHCAAFTVVTAGRAGAPVPGKYIGACYLKRNCSGLSPDNTGSISGMRGGQPFPFANRTFTNCKANTFPMMCKAADSPGQCHWCGSAAAGSCFANKTACPLEQKAAAVGKTDDAIHRRPRPDWAWNE